MRIAYQGVPGAYGEEAARRCASGPQDPLIGFVSFEDVFEAVAARAVDAGVVPIENSLHGSVLDNYDLLLEHELQIVGEVSLPIRHCLLVPPGRQLQDVTWCASHPQALAQCGRWLREHDIEQRAASNTAVAARDLAASREPGGAAIASAHAASIYGLEILATDIQARSTNTTRFLLLQPERPRELRGERASIVFSTENVPGALLRCLERIAGLGLNMTRLESRPTGDALWEYHFYADVEAGSGTELTEQLVEQLVADIRGADGFARVLGRYPAAAAR